MNDTIHAYASSGGSVGRGDGDKRPPDGGKYSCDINDHWVRTVNPNIYHHFDENSHRWTVSNETDGEILGGDWVQYSTCIPSHRWLPKQCDPKEHNLSPLYYLDTPRVKWKYGSKVGISKSQITKLRTTTGKVPTLGPISAVSRNGFIMTGTSTSYHPICSDRQYTSVYNRETGDVGAGREIAYGYAPDMDTHETDVGGQGGQDAQSAEMAFDDAYQNMVQYAVSHRDWAEEVNATYKKNWIDYNWYSQAYFNSSSTAWTGVSHPSGTVVHY